jgi:hypothetical protein
MREHEATRDEGERRESAPAAAQTQSSSDLLRLQQTAGNAAVARLLARQPAPAASGSTAAPAQAPAARVIHGMEMLVFEDGTASMNMTYGGGSRLGGNSQGVMAPWPGRSLPTGDMADPYWYPRRPTP